ncbi:hypothetical protein TNIN_350491 [Trichonephila inaurata madagascariensis]|uniref:Uncharacterized protein n=1 Tax=Trichonephila inaurata madagascariensis TaxID=2747483 RepID=A0A8X6YL43_9ARAC|nr:hypothetical protein TNIN_350491 [Trichonephila inaurata madagascariensis]
MANFCVDAGRIFPQRPLVVSVGIRTPFNMYAAWGLRALCTIVVVDVQPYPWDRAHSKCTNFDCFSWSIMLEVVFLKSSLFSSGCRCRYLRMASVGRDVSSCVREHIAHEVGVYGVALEDDFLQHVDC